MNTVNCVGVMGKGLALQFKKAYPENFAAYSRACDAGEVEPGIMYIFNTGAMTNPKYIINFPTKRHWKEKSRIKDVEDGLRALVEDIRKRNIKSIAVPPLGCGLGGLKWSAVQTMIEKAFMELPVINVILFAPEETNDAGPISSQSIDNKAQGVN